MQSPTNEVLTVSEVAERLRVDRQTVARWCRDGLIAAFQLPAGSWRITVAEVDRIVAGGAPPTEASATVQGDVVEPARTDRPRHLTDPPAAPAEVTVPKAVAG